MDYKFKVGDKARIIAHPMGSKGLYNEEVGDIAEVTKNYVTSFENPGAVISNDKFTCPVHLNEKWLELVED